MSKTEKALQTERVELKDLLSTDWRRGDAVSQVWTARLTTIEHALSNLATRRANLAVRRASDQRYRETA